MPLECKNLKNCKMTPLPYTKARLSNKTKTLSLLATRKLRYYASFKVRKFESLFYKINTYLQKTTPCIRLRAEQIFSVDTKYTYFSILGVAFTVPFLCYFQKLQLLVVKKFWTNFCSIVLLYLWAQKLCLIFLKPYFTGDINIFVLRGVFFSRYVLLKSSFSGEKNISAEIWDTLL